MIKINKAKSTKVLYHKEQLVELYKYPNLTLLYFLLYLYMSKKTKCSFRNLLYRDQVPLIFYFKFEVTMIGESWKKGGKKPFQYFLISHYNY